jgi:hypothetical protein
MLDEELAKQCVDVRELGDNGVAVADLTSNLAVQYGVTPRSHHHGLRADPAVGRGLAPSRFRRNPVLRQTRPRAYRCMPLHC